MTTKAATTTEIILTGNDAERLTCPPATTALETPASSSSSSPQSLSPPPLCKHWARSKICLYHAKGKCKFSHPPDYELPPPKPSKNRRNHKPQTDLTHRHRSAGGRLQTRNDARVAILRAFLANKLKEHGIPDLSQYNVLDVAGGKGELAFQLLNLNNVARCHVIDPRPLSLGRFQKRLSRGFYHRSQGILQHDVIRPQTEPERSVDQLRCFFSNELWEEGEKSNKNENKKSKDDNNEETKEKEKTIGGDDAARINGNNANDKSKTADHYQKQRQQFFANCYKARGWVWPPVGDVNEHAAACGKHYYEDRDDDDFNTKTKPSSATDNSAAAAPNVVTDDEDTIQPREGEETIEFDHASSVVKTANLIVGMHPDQAVDAIVDAALYQNISFFVVPCCTYSREFPNRRIRIKNKNDNSSGEGLANSLSIANTKLVTTYEELVDYLQAKSPDIQRHILPFEGRNICLYRVVNQEEEGNH